MSLPISLSLATAGRCITLYNTRAHLLHDEQIQDFICTGKQGELKEESIKGKLQGNSSSLFTC
jgi:hypothetical protein